MQFDLRTISHRDLLHELHRLENLYGKLQLTRNADETLTAEPIAQPTSTLQGIAQLGLKVLKATAEQNLADQLKQTLGTSQMATTNITGAKTLSEQFKNKVAAAKQKINDANTKMDGAVANLNKGADFAATLADNISKEADDLMASVGQLSNMPPEGK